MGIWRDWFGPGQTEIWAGVARELDAEVTGIGLLENMRIELVRAPYSITLDTFTRGWGQHSQSYTRMCSRFWNPKQLRFLVYREGWFSELGRLLGMQDIFLGVGEFDSDFVIKGEPETFVRSLLSDARVRKLVNAQSKMHLSIQTDNPFFGAPYVDSVDELYFECHGIMKDPALLKQLFELFIAVIDRMEEIEPQCEFRMHLVD